MYTCQQFHFLVLSVWMIYARYHWPLLTHLLCSQPAEFSVYWQRGFQLSHFLNSNPRPSNHHHHHSSSSAPLKGFSDYQHSSSGAAWKEGGWEGEGGTKRGRGRQTFRCVAPSKVMKEAPCSLITWQGHRAAVTSQKHLWCSKLYLFAHKKAPPCTWKHPHTHAHAPIGVLCAWRRHTSVRVNK